MRILKCIKSGIERKGENRKKKKEDEVSIARPFLLLDRFCFRNVSLSLIVPAPLWDKRFDQVLLKNTFV